MMRLRYVRYTVTCAIIGLLGSTGWADTPTATRTKIDLSQWEVDIATHYDAVRLLFKNAPAGNNGSEVDRWEAKALKDNPERIKNLQKLLDDYPDCPFADDAALLLARAQFLYKGDSKAAIDGLYEVIKKYPDGIWFAGDPVVLEILAPLAGHLKSYRNDTGTLRIKVIDDTKIAETETGESRSEFSQAIEYLDYLQAHPNKTADEAKYWIAWIIMQARLKDRYPEAERLLQELKQQHADSNRSQDDVKAAKELKNSLVKRLPRVEQDASAMLVELLERTGKKSEALTEAKQAAERYKGTPFTKWANEKVDELKQK